MTKRAQDVFYSKIRQATEKFVADLGKELTKLLDDIGRRKVSLPSSSNGKSVIKVKSRDEMRCRFNDGSGHRCKERSKGPRFHYLCSKHIDVHQEVERQRSTAPVS